MFGLTYLPNDRKRQLRRLQEKLATQTNPKVRNETNLLIQEIMSEAKSYLLCDKFDLAELRNQILENISTLNKLGKAEGIEAFQIHLKEVDFRLETLTMEDAMKEKTRLRSDDPPNLKEGRSLSQNALERQRIAHKKEARGRTRWVIGMEDE